ncbi:MAG TPA: flavin reductase family protein [Mycobacteriales bacterium]
MVSGVSNVNGHGDNTFGPAMFRTAMSRFPTGVTIVTTHDEHGIPFGFTASSFCSVSMNPPLILVCLARSANSYPVFAHCDRFAVSMLQPHHTELAKRFASKDTNKFDGGPFTRTPTGLTAVNKALAVMECTVHERHEAGDHIIMIGRVEWVQARTGSPVIYHDRGFHTLDPHPVDPVDPAGTVDPTADRVRTDPPDRLDPPDRRTRGVHRVREEPVGPGTKN